MLSDKQGADDNSTSKKNRERLVIYFVQLF